MSSFLLNFISISALLCVSRSEVVNLKVFSKVNLNSQLVHEKNEIFFANKGPNLLTTYDYVIEEPGLHLISFYNEEGHLLDYIKHPNGSNLHFKVALNESLPSGQQSKIFVKIIYGGKILPATKNRKFDEDQLMKYEGNVLCFSSYTTELYRVEYLISNDSLTEVTKDPTLFENDNTLVYIFNDIGVYETDPILIVFINNDPFLVVRSLYRTIDVSHFGKITIKDEVILENIGPRLVGPFSPLPKTAIKKAATHWLYTHLPVTAENIKFYDVLGNSSQTKIYRYVNYLTLKFRTRYPLLGGWKTSYILRYDVPIHEYLLVSGDVYSLQIRAIDYVVADAVIEDAVIKITFPEGGRVDNIFRPDWLHLRSEETGCSGGFCVYGRPVIVLNATNLFHNYVESIGVEYFLNPLYLFRVPILITVYLEGVFVVVLCGVRYFSCSK